MPATATGLKDLYRSMVLIREAEEAVLRSASHITLPGWRTPTSTETATASSSAQSKPDAVPGRRFNVS